MSTDFLSDQVETAFHVSVLLKLLAVTIGNVIHPVWIGGDRVIMRNSPFSLVKHFQYRFDHAGLLSNFSMRINHVCAIPKWFDDVFVVAADKESVKRFLSLPNAGECNGKKCKECGFKCYTKAWEKGTVIVKYLRGVNPSVRKAIVAACKAREEQ